MKQHLKEIAIFLSPFLVLYPLLGGLSYLVIMKSDWFIAGGWFFLSFMKLEDYEPYALADEIDIRIEVWQLFLLVGLFTFLMILLSKLIDIIIRKQKQNKEFFHG